MLMFISNFQFSVCQRSLEVIMSTISAQDTFDSPLGNSSPVPLLSASAVSWGAILAGAAAAAALSLILLILGTGLGLSSMSPWVHDKISATTLSVSTILWLTLTQLVAAGMGGYLAGRLRTKWVTVHSDEVYFRDTAHGFLAWAVASLATAVLLTSVIGSIVGGGIQAGASAVGSIAGTAAGGSERAIIDGDGGSTGYFVDSLFRKDLTAVSVGSDPARRGVMSTEATEHALDASSAEVTRIFMTTIHSGKMSVEDVRYVGQLVAQRTGLSQADAQQRVSDTYARLQTKLRGAETAAKDAAEKGRKASAYAALWLFVSLLSGAFVASWAATYGGRRRDV
jgi:hypothetical protein